MTKHWRTVIKMKKWGNKGISYRELQSNEAQNLDLEVYKSKNYYI